MSDCGFVVIVFCVALMMYIMVVCIQFSFTIKFVSEFLFGSETLYCTHGKLRIGIDHINSRDTKCLYNRATLQCLKVSFFTLLHILKTLTVFKLTCDEGMFHFKELDK